MSVATLRVTAVCDQCGFGRRPGQHTGEFDGARGVPHSFFADWYTKHTGHVGVRFLWPERTAKLARPAPPTRQPWESFLHNADVKVAYAASASPTFTLASLAASSTLLAGRESTAIDNGASVKYLDYLAAGNFVSAAANNAAGSIIVAVVGAQNDTPTWPLVFDGTDSTVTVALQGQFDAICKVLTSIAATNAASTTWPFGPVSVASMFGGWIPDQFVYFVAHNIQTTTNAWNASGNTFVHTPIFATVA